MTKKLTLSMDEKTILTAKRYSRKKGKSISSIVASYLNTLSDSECPKESSVELMVGLLKGKMPPHANWKTIRDEQIAKKHGL